MYRRIEHRSNQSVLWKDRTVWICKTKIGRDARGSRHDLVYMTCPTTTKSKISFEKKSMVRTYGRWSTTLFALIHFLRNDWRVHANAAIPNKFNNPGRIVQAIVCVYACVLLGIWVDELSEMPYSTWAIYLRLMMCSCWRVSLLMIVWFSWMMMIQLWVLHSSGRLVTTSIPTQQRILIFGRIPVCS